MRLLEACMRLLHSEPTMRRQDSQPTRAVYGYSAMQVEGVQVERVQVERVHIEGVQVCGWRCVAGGVWM